jgi:SpoVK/Ycf46/Vps4 family AAA+-type ATPase
MLSMFDYNKNTDLSKIFESGIVVIKDLKAFEMLDEQDKTLFMFNLKKHLDGKHIVILFDEGHNISKFLTYDRELGLKYFSFKLNGIDPDIQDVYNEILGKVKLDEQNSIKLLDYMTSTYLKNEDDYLTYRDKLVNYISFNNGIPEIKKTKTNEEIFKELDELVGLKDVKEALRDLVNLIGLKSKTEGDLKIKDINLHMLFLGNPGTGKTTVARLLSGILYNLGYIKEDKLIEVSSKDLVAEYVGQTAPKTNAVVERAKGGILFIDEAYALASDGNSSYNDEAIATLIKAMEDFRDDLVVIFAGYTKEMEAFLNSNSGIVSRIGYTMNFADYTVDELLSIFKQMINKAGFKITDEALEKTKNIISENVGTENFGNARFVRNMYEKTVVRHATNTKDNKKKNKLITITADDINIDNLIN